MSYRVLHLIGGGEIGGAEQHLLSLFANFQPERVKPYLGCLIPNSPFASLAHSKGIHTNLFPMRFPLDISPVLRVVKFCRTNEINIIHSHGARANLIGRLAAKYLSIPCITTIHSLPEYDYSSVWKAKTALLLDNLTIHLSSGIITVSNSIYKSTSALMGENTVIPIKTVYNGSPNLDFSNRTELRDVFRKKWGISDNALVVGTIGRLHPVKGHKYLILALELLSKEITNLHFVLIGDGPMREQLSDELNKTGLSYTMTGHQLYAWQCLPAMDIFVLPSINEGMGLVLLEAAQAEVPIIASRVGGIPEIWENETSALLVNPAKPEEIARACKVLLQDNNVTKHLTANALYKALSLDEETMAEETTSFYDSSLNQSRKISATIL